MTAAPPAIYPAIYTVTLNPGLDRTLTVPELSENRVLRATTTQIDWGGKGFNVTRALHALGRASVAFGLVGGCTGQMLTQGLHELGIATDFVTIPGETRTNTVIQSADGRRHIKVNEPGPTVDAAALAALAARIEATVTPGSLWALCGSLPPGAPPDTYATLIALIRDRGGRVCLDASGAALRAGLAARPDWVKPNAEEAADLTGTPITDLDTATRAAARCLDLGARNVALSLGADGLLLAAPGQIIHAQPPAVAVQTLVGVGDALLGGLLDALAQGWPLPEVARWAVAAGTAAAMTPGVGVGSLADVTALAAHVTVTVR
jgi:1-phosphofructokinase family hexose kinase